MALRGLSLGKKALLATTGAGLIGIISYYRAFPLFREVYMTSIDKPEATGGDAKLAEDAYKKLQASAKCHSLLKKHLTKETLDKLKYRKTKQGAILFDVLRAGIGHDMDTASIGILAPDGESYTVFKELFDPVIQDYHKFGPDKKQPPVDLGNDKIDTLPELDPDGKYIISTRIRCARKVEGFPFNPLLSESDYLVLEAKVKNALQEVPEPQLKGQYYPLDGMTKKDQAQLVKDHFLFRDDDPYQKDANACRFWPKGRGIFHNTDKTFLVWVNEEDHIRIISMQKGGNVGQVLQRLNKGIQALEKKVPFTRDDRLGWLTFCPTNLGSTIRASVHVKLPITSARKDFKELCEKLNLQPRGVDGEQSKSEGGVYDISNKARLGLSEYAAIKQMYDGVKTLIAMEKNGGRDL